MKQAALRFVSALLVLSVLAMPALASGTGEAVTVEEQKYLEEADAPRFAIVIYEYDYNDPRVDREAVGNAENDATKLAKLLDDAGYRPRLLRSPTKDEILREVEFLMTGQVRQEQNRGIRPIVFMFFAGHGYQVDNADYLAPRDFDQTRPVDTGLPLVKLVEIIGRQASFLLFNDACRTLRTAEQKQTGESMDDPRPLQIGARDLADARRNPLSYLISHAADKNHVAFGASASALNSSPYSAVLMQELFSQGAEFRAALTWVRKNVGVRTANAQVPIVDDGGAAPPEYYFSPTQGSNEASYRKWLDAMRSGDAEKVDRFIEAGASSRYLRAAVRYRQDHASR